MEVSHKWAKCAKGWLGIESGRHCHWCRYADKRDGGSYCNKKECKRYECMIELGMGVKIAEKCWFFELNVLYTKDENFDMFFGRKE